MISKFYSSKVRYRTFSFSSAVLVLNKGPAIRLGLYPRYPTARHKNRISLFEPNA